MKKMIVHSDRRLSGMIICILCNIGIGILLPCFLCGVLWLMTGSLEMEPTLEQIEKSRISAVIFMLVTGISCVVCIYFRIKIEFLAFLSIDSGKTALKINPLKCFQTHHYGETFSLDGDIPTD